MCDLPPEAADPPHFILDALMPTTARAGSAEKVEVLARRYLLGAPLWHPDDNPEQAGPSEHDPNW